jgi:colicin import membrane protein
LPKTKDGFPCEIDALFTVEIGRTLGEIEKATSRITAGTDVEAIVRHENFAKELLPELRIAVNASLEVVQILTGEEIDASCGHGSSRAKVKAAIREEAGKVLSALGFLLRDLEFDFTPVEPDPAERVANPDLIKAWQRFAQELEAIKQEDKKRKDEAETKVEIQRQQLAIDRDRAVGELQDQEKEANAIRDERRARADLARFESLAGIRLEKEQAETRDIEAREQIKRDREKRGRQLQQAETQEKVEHQKLLQANEVESESDKAAQAQQLLAIKGKSNSELLSRELEESQEKAKIDEQRYALALAQAARDAEDEAKRKVEQLEHARHELELANARTQLAETESRLAILKKTEIESIGEAEAKAAKAKTLAAHAHLIHMHETLMQALPQVLEKATLSGKSLGEVRVLYTGGGGVHDGANQQSGLGNDVQSLLSSFSSISVLREMLRFIGDFPGFGEQPETAANPGTSPAVTNRRDSLLNGAGQPAASSL